MMKLVALRLGVFAVILTNAELAQADSDRFGSLPPGWAVQRSVRVPDAQLVTFSSKLGGEISAASNHFLVADGKRIQVNTLTCKTREDSNKVVDALMRIKKNPDMVLRVGSEVIEFVCDDVRLARRAHYELGLKPRHTQYEVAFDVAPVASGDYSAWNRLFNACLASEQNKAVILELAKRFQFGDEVVMRTDGQGGNKSTLKFVPAPIRQSNRAGGELVVQSFINLPSEHGIPRLRTDGLRKRLRAVIYQRIGRTVDRVHIAGPCAAGAVGGRYREVILVQRLAPSLARFDVAHLFGKPLTLPSPRPAGRGINPPLPRACGERTGEGVDNEFLHKRQQISQVIG